MQGKKRILFRFLIAPFFLAILFPFFIENWMRSHFLAGPYFFLWAFCLAFGLTPFLYKMGISLDITDHPGGRHLHQHVTPRTGGIAIFIAFIISINFVQLPSTDFRAFFLASIIIGIMGIFDDIRRLPATLKLLGQILAATVLVINGFVFSFFPSHPVLNILSVVLTYIWILGITNAFNFLDGLDGLCAGLGIVIMLFYALLSHLIGNPVMVYICLILAGALFGFLPFNFRHRKRALIFLGDTGSTFIGFTIAALSIYGDWGNNKITDLAIPIILLAVPITDMTLATIVRIVKKKVRTIGELLSYTGTDHFHHRLMSLGLSAKTAVTMIYILTILMGLLSLLLWKGDFQDSIIALLMAIIIFYVITAFMIFEEKRNGLIK